MKTADYRRRLLDAMDALMDVVWDYCGPPYTEAKRPVPESLRQALVSTQRFAAEVATADVDGISKSLNEWSKK